MNRYLSLLVLALSSALVTSTQADPAVATKLVPSFEQVGFSTLTAYGQAGTTGGGTAAPIAVHNAQEFQSACERLDLKDKKARDHTPRVVLVANDIDLSVLANQKGGTVLTNVGVVRIRPNTTIYSTNGATIRRGTLEVHSAWNIIIRNLTFRDLWEYDRTGKYDKLGWDFVRITSSGGKPSHHIWVDHCDFGKAYDGQCDIVHGSDCITVSWCKFAGDERGPHKKSMLIGHSSSANAAAMDRGHLNVTLHHNWYENIDDRTPRARFGNIHCFNNLIEGAQNANISVMTAVTLIEDCVYRDVKTASTFSHAKDSVLKEKGGTICLVDSRNENPRKATVAEKADEKFEQENNFKSNVEREKLQFNKPAELTWTNLNALPYAYRADSAEVTPELVKQWAGVGKVKF